MKILKKYYLFLLVLFFIIAFSGCNKNQNSLNSVKNTEKSISSDNALNENPFKGMSVSKMINTKTYNDKTYNFKVKYPGNWKTEITKRWTATKTHEASPDGGIYIYPDGDKSNRIYIYGQFYQISTDPYIPFYSERFLINNNIKGTLYYESQNGKTTIFLLIDDNLHAAHIEVSDKCFSKNRQQIFDILKSIKVIDTKKNK